MLKMAVLLEIKFLKGPRLLPAVADVEEPRLQQLEQITKVTVRIVDHRQLVRLLMPQKAMRRRRTQVKMIVVVAKTKDVEEVVATTTEARTRTVGCTSSITWNA